MLPLPILSSRQTTIKAVFTPRDLDAYAALLPRPFAPPPAPRVLVELTQVTPRWHEGIVSLACRHRGVDAWHGLYWAIDAFLPYHLGRLVGYPKFVAERMTFTPGERPRGEVHRAGRATLAVSFARADPATWPARFGADATAAATALRDSTGDRPYVLLVPPGRGPLRTRLSFHEVRVPRRSIRAGVATIHFTDDEPCARLFPAGPLDAPAKLVEQHGAGFGWLVARRA